MIEKELPITVYHGLAAAFPPDGKDIQTERQKRTNPRIGFQRSNGWVTEMLTALVDNDDGVKTGATVRVTMEIVHTEKEEK